MYLSNTAWRFVDFYRDQLCSFDLLFPKISTPTFYFFFYLLLIYSSFSSFFKDCISHIQQVSHLLLFFSESTFWPVSI